MNTHHPHAASASITSVVSESAGPRRRPGGRSARIQEAVFEATLHLLQEKGYEALSFATIAERAGVHETSLYRRWRTKDQLTVAAVTSQVAQDIPVPDTGLLRSDLILLLQSLRAFLLSSVGQAIVQTAIVTTLVPALNSLHRDIWHRRRAHLQIVFDRAVARGELSPQTDFQLLLETLIGVFYLRPFIFNEPLDETLPERIVDLVLLAVYTSKPTE
jgi:AcrR family transcriptional regulator